MRHLITLILFTCSFIVHAESGCSQGMEFDSKLNRCVLTKETVDQKTEARNCETLEGSARQQCLNKNVDNTNIGQTQDPKANYFLPGIVTLGGAYVIFMAKDKIKGCGSISIYLMFGAGAATLLGEFLAQKKYKEKLKELSQRYEQRLKASSDLKDDDQIQILNENQVIAFDYQIEQERARASAHKSRKKTYTLALGLYSAAAVAAIIEHFKYATGAGSTCNISGTAKNASTSTPADSSKSATDAAGTADKGGFNLEGIKDAASMVGSTITNGLRTPWVRAALAGVLAMHSKSVADKAGKLADEAEGRAKALEEIRDNFIASGGAGFAYCSDSDRRNPSKGECYCYSEDGSKNMSRESSPTCQKIWNVNTNTNQLASSNQLANSDNEVTGCLNSDASFNSNCDCKVKQCTTFNGSIDLGPLSNINGTNKMMKDTEALTKGGLSTASLNDKGLNNLASRIKGEQKKLAKNPKMAPTLKKINDLQLKMNRGLGAKIRSSIKRSGVAPAFARNNAGFGSGPNISKPSDALKAARANLAKDINKPGKIAALGFKSKPKPNFDFDFGGDSSEGGVAIEDENADIMNKDFKINDIHQNDYGNLFQIIHNRYQSSGMKKLFAGEVEEKASE